MSELIFVVDNAPDLCKMIEIQLTSEGYRVKTAHSGQDALELMKEQVPDLVITDLQMPGLNGIETMQRIHQMYPTMPIIILTAHGSVDSAVEAMKLGAYDYLQKPFTTSRLYTVISHALEAQRLKSEVNTLKNIVEQEIPLKKIVGSSDALNAVLTSVRKAFNLDTTVLILGESGTGKDLLAQTIHDHSTNRDQTKFVAVNCAALPETILESELFGHEKGAFTGATDRKIGKFEFAKGGTLFLDEVCEMSPITQAKLLRVLQEKEIQRLGSNETISIDIRVIAATNKDIEAYVAEGKFREDLYYRLNVFTVHMPPLRERKSDIEELTNHFIKGFNKKLSKDPHVKRVDSEALDLLVSYDWPGNIRELQNIIERTMIETDNDLVKVSDFPYTFTKKIDPSQMTTLENLSSKDLPSTIEQMERKMILAALEKYNNNVSDVAKALKIGRTTLYRKAEQYQITLKK
jgi:DNA-binding NtrC family response regulator